MPDDLILSEGLGNLNIEKQQQDALNESLENANVKIITFNYDWGFLQPSFNKYRGKISAVFDLSDNDTKEFVEQVKKMQIIGDETRKKVQVYINNFRTAISRELSSQIGQKFNIVAFPNGVAIDIEQSPFIANEDVFIGLAPSISDAFNQLNKDVSNYLQGEELENYRKKLSNNQRSDSGTDIFFGKSIFIVKGDNEIYWTAKEAKRDVTAIIKHINELSKNGRTK